MSDIGDIDSLRAATGGRPDEMETGVNGGTSSGCFVTGLVSSTTRQRNGWMRQRVRSWSWAKAVPERRVTDKAIYTSLAMVCKNDALDGRSFARTRVSTRIPWEDNTTKGPPQSDRPVGLHPNRNQKARAHLRTQCPHKKRKRTPCLTRSDEKQSWMSPSPGLNSMLSRADSQAALPSSTCSGKHTSNRAILSEEQRPLGAETQMPSSQFGHPGTRRFCFLSFLLKKKILRKYFAVPFGRGRRRPISS